MASATIPDFDLSITDCPIIQFDGWDETLVRFETSLSQVLGAALPALVGDTVRHAGTLVVRVAPRRFWLISENGAEVSSPLIDPELGCSVPLREGRVRFQMAGAGVPRILSACIAVDWQSPAAGPGRALQTSFHRVPVLLIRTADSACDLLAPRSFARSLADWITDAAKPYAARVPAMVRA
jgi:methylglutamate dehydrogenase subunit D